MYEIDERLYELDKDCNPIMVGVIGVGQMGGEIISQINLMRGMRVAIAVDLEYETVLKAFEDNFSPNFLAFHIPKEVSIIVDKATINIMPFIGAKNNIKE